MQNADTYKFGTLLYSMIALALIGLLFWSVGKVVPEQRTVALTTGILLFVPLAVFFAYAAMNTYRPNRKAVRLSFHATMVLSGLIFYGLLTAVLVWTDQSTDTAHIRSAIVFIALGCLLTGLSWYSHRYLKHQVNLPDER